jgi:hypothetical protein
MLEQVAQRVAAKVYFAELASARSLGYPGVDAYVSAFRAMDSTYIAAFEVHRPAVLTRFRPLRSVGELPFNFNILIGNRK